MQIWTYAHEDANIEQVRADVWRETCPYCSSALHRPRYKHDQANYGDYARFEDFVVRCCPMCGWWSVFRSRVVREGTCGTFRLSSDEKRYGASGVLRNLDLSDQSLPLETIRAYIAARYESRFDVAPTKMEAVVASVYSEFGKTAVAVGCTGDGGVDVVLQDDSGNCIGVQVKRNRGRIEAETIRAFVGALYLKKMLAGIFVTTSEYTRGARNAAAMAAERRIPIELIDAKRFYDQLKIAQRTAYERIDDPSAPYANAELLLLSSHSEPFREHF